LDGFSIGRYKKKGESFDLYAAKFESGAMRFWREKFWGELTRKYIQNFSKHPKYIQYSINIKF